MYNMTIVGVSFNRFSSWLTDSFCTHLVTKNTFLLQFLLRNRPVSVRLRSTTLPVPTNTAPPLHIRVFQYEPPLSRRPAPPPDPALALLSAYSAPWGCVVGGLCKNRRTLWSPPLLSLLPFVFVNLTWSWVCCFGCCEVLYNLLHSPLLRD